MSVYPPAVQRRCEAPANAGIVRGANGGGKDATFVCGTFVSFSLRIDGVSGQVNDIKFRSSGCGFMIATADVLCETFKRRRLADLHGLQNDELRSIITAELGTNDDSRLHCGETCISALHAAFSDHRKRCMEEFSGDKALICTCFGISEETIERHIASGTLETVDEVTAVSRAGGGCGSCA